MPPLRFPRLQAIGLNQILNRPHGDSQQFGCIAGSAVPIVALIAEILFHAFATSFINFVIFTVCGSPNSFQRMNGKPYFLL